LAVSTRYSFFFSALIYEEENGRMYTQRAHAHGALIGCSLLIVGALAACRDKCGPPDRGCTARHTASHSAASMTTDQSTYSAQPNCSPVGHPCAVVPITVTFRNPLDRDILLERCTPDAPTPMFAVVYADEKHSPAPMNPDWACVGHDSSLVVPRGASRQDVVNIGLGPEQAAHAGTELGPFRIAYLARLVGGREALIPDSLRMSTQFRIRIAGAGSRP
jgi:hypothetical protein